MTDPSATADLSPVLGRRREVLRCAAALAGALTLPPIGRAANPTGDGSAAVERWLREGGVVIAFRHALAPGTFDPPEFRLGDCSTQRNLNDEGRAQARRIGQWFSSRGLKPARVRSSPWCRCVDTAQLAFGRYAQWPALNSFFQGQGDGNAQTREVLETVAALRAPVNWVLVTHQVNISALTGEYPAMGELFVTRPDTAAPGQLRVLARRVI